MKQKHKALCCLCSVLLVAGICIPSGVGLALPLSNSTSTQTQTATAQNQAKTKVENQQETKVQKDQKSEQEEQAQQSKQSQQVQESKSQEQPVAETQTEPANDQQSASVQTTPANEPSTNTRAAGDISQNINATLSIMSNGQSVDQITSNQTVDFVWTFTVDGSAQAGDYFTINLPANADFANGSDGMTFPILNSDGVAIGNAVFHTGSPATVPVTFTHGDYLAAHPNNQHGTITLQARYMDNGGHGGNLWNETFNSSVGGKVIPGVPVTIVPGTGTHDAVTKWGQSASDNNHAAWTVQIGYNGATFNDLTLVDQASSDAFAPQYDADSFHLYRVLANGVWDPVDISNSLTISGNHFSLHIGKTTGRMILTYTTTYQPDAMLNNEITATDMGNNAGTFTSSYHSVNGSGDINGDPNAKPVEPTQPDQPTQPDEPQQPETPDQPEQPETPVTPEEPEQPITPETPAAPEGLSEPETPQQVIEQAKQDAKDQAAQSTEQMNEAQPEQANALPQTGDSLQIVVNGIVALILVSLAVGMIAYVRSSKH